MIDDALIFLRDHLNTYLSQADSPAEAPKPRVVFVGGDRMDPLTFTVGAVSALLVNIEEENSLRPPDLYRRTSPAGAAQKAQPEIRLNFYVLFVAHFNLYEDSLKYLSLVIQHFLDYRLLDHQNAPELSEKIEKLVVELVTLPFSEQNEVWSALRVTYHPSVLYKVRMVVFQGEDVVVAPQIKTTETQIRTSR